MGLPWPPAGPRPNLERNGVAIPFKGGMANLTAMWKACGARPEQRPFRWKLLAEARKFIKSLADSTGIGSEKNLWLGQAGGMEAGTTAHWQIAMEYARWLDPAFAMWVNEVAAQFMQQDAQGVPYVEQKTAEAVSYGVARK